MNNRTKGTARQPVPDSHATVPDSNARYQTEKVGTPLSMEFSCLRYENGDYRSRCISWNRDVNYINHTNLLYRYIRRLSVCSFLFHPLQRTLSIGRISIRHRNLSPSHRGWISHLMLGHAGMYSLKKNQ